MTDKFTMVLNGKDEKIIFITPTFFYIKDKGLCITWLKYTLRFSKWSKRK